MKTTLKVFSFFALCALLFTACSNPTGRDPSDEEFGKFTINLGAKVNSRAAYPPTSPADIAELKFVVYFSSGGSVVKTFTADGTDVITGSIATGTYTVTMDVFLKADNSLFAEGQAISPGNPVVIGTGTNFITIRAHKSVIFPLLLQ